METDTENSEADSPRTVRALLESVAAWEKSADALKQAWHIVDIDQAVSEGGATLTPQDDGSLLAGGERPDKDTYVITARSELRRITGIRLEVLTDDSLPMKGPGRQDNGNLHLNELRVAVVTVGGNEAAAGGADVVSEKAATESKPLTLVNPRADFNQDGWSIDRAIDGNDATAWGIFPEVGKPHQAVFEFAEPVECEDDAAADDGHVHHPVLQFTLQQSHGGGHLIGRPRLSVTDLAPPWPLDVAPIPAAVAEAVAVPAAERSDAQRAALAVYWLAEQVDRALGALPPQSLVYCGTHDFIPDNSFKPTPMPREVHVLTRGDITKPGDLAQPGALSCVPGLDSRFELADPNDEGERRAALARWLTDSANGLAWRSIANRLWHYHFGRGIVDTPNDFGQMGSPPTHPELLDWLAGEMLRSGGSLKRMHRLIVTSAVYRQSSADEPEHSLRDADNRYLWRMNRTRLEAESIRDAVLATSGELDLTMGGPSVKQFIQTPGIHVTPNVDYASFDPDDPANRRRSVYRFIFRTLPDPFMDALDCPDSSQLAPKRSESVTALQALAMLNDKFIIRQSEHLAERASRRTTELPDQVVEVYRQILGRQPTEHERTMVADYAAKHGLANACRMLINSNEFLFVD